MERVPTQKSVGRPNTPVQCRNKSHCCAVPTHGYTRVGTAVVVHLAYRFACGTHRRQSSQRVARMMITVLSQQLLCVTYKSSNNSPPRFVELLHRRLCVGVFVTLRYCGRVTALSKPQLSNPLVLLRSRSHHLAGVFMGGSEVHRDISR